MNIRTQTVGGEVYNDHDQPPRRFPAGRECAEPDWRTVYDDPPFPAELNT